MRLCGKRKFACWNKRRGDGSGDIRSCTLMSFCAWLYRGWPVAHMEAMLLSRPAFAGVQKPWHRTGRARHSGQWSVSAQAVGQSDRKWPGCPVFVQYECWRRCVGWERFSVCGRKQFSAHVFIWRGRACAYQRGGGSRRPYLRLTRSSFSSIGSAANQRNNPVAAPWTQSMGKPER